MSAFLEIRGLRTYFHQRERVVKAIDGVDLELERGRTLCLVGESGSGKSLTALSIMRLVDHPGRIEPGSAITFDSLDLVAATEKQLQSIRGNEISMIFQEPMTSLNPAHTVGAQIAEAVLLHRPVSKKEALDRAVEMLRLVGVPDPERRRHDFPHQLSGGMRQRVMIAMALSCEPKLLIADEPTTALDVTIQAQILELLRELRDRLGMAVLLITHDLGVVAEMADDVAVMYAGRIVERGSVQDTFAHPQHPYTQALLRSIPVLGMRHDQRLAVIPGMVPSPARWPTGCRFAARCEHAYERCVEYPPTFAVGDQSAVCWLREPQAVAKVGQ
jgi:oligopeptide/dipeptide ABC transporter ATP-binding protein